MSILIYKKEMKEEDRLNDKMNDGLKELEEINSKLKTGFNNLKQTLEEERNRFLNR